MEIKSLIARKSQLDRTLRDIINQELKTFYDDTGFSPNTIRIYLDNVNSIGQMQARYIVNEVECDIDIWN